MSAGDGDPLGSPLSVLVVDNDDLMRAALSDLVEATPGLVLCGSARDADEAIERSRATRPHVALLDVKMPAGGGLRAAARIRAVSPDTRLVALSAYTDPRTMAEMIGAGVDAYLPKESPRALILYALREPSDRRGRRGGEAAA